MTSFLGGIATKFLTSSTSVNNSLQETSKAPDATIKPQKPSTHTEGRVYEQESFRAGLMVTDELNKAITECKRKVEEIAAACRRKNRRFRDTEFDLERDQDNCLNSLSTANDKYKPADCLRVSQIFENPQFMVDGADSSDIVQGALGDCWFLCAVATLTTMPDLINTICVAHDEKAGVYGFIFCRDGEWVHVIIDDQLYVKVPKWETLSYESQILYHKEKDKYESIARKGSKTLYFASSSQENETWVPLLEKAYAKFHGDYASLEGGYGSQALEDLTGGVSQIIFPSDIYDKDEFWEKELMQAAKTKLFSCYTGSLAGSGYATDDTTIKGLISSHAYSILRAVEFNGKRFLKIRNPWGDSEWTGRWSDGSKEWSKEWLLALEALEHEFGDDGSFIMEYEDFLQTWYAIEIITLFDESWVRSTHWLNVESRSYPCPWQYGDVSFTFTISEASPAIIVLSKSDHRFWSDLSGYSDWMFEFVLYKKGQVTLLGESDYTLQYPLSVSLSTHLEPGEYVVHVRLDRTIFRDKQYVATNSPNWDNRKLSRVSAELARSMSMAANYDHKKWRDTKVVPTDIFAGKDLIQLELESFEESMAVKKAGKQNFFPKPKPTLSVPTVVSQTISVSEDTIVNDGAQAQQSTVNVVAVINSTAAPVKMNEAGANGVLMEHPVTVDDQSHGSADAAASSNSPKEPPSIVEAQVAEKTTPEADKFQSLPPDVHSGYSCKGCGKDPIVGVRWHCNVCQGYDLCSECHLTGKATEQHSVAHSMLRIEDRDAAPLPTHNFICNGCGVSPITGTRMHCLVCSDYDLCSACHASGAHPGEHAMLKVETPEDGEDTSYETGPDENNAVLLGLRVYSKKGSKVAISGQLRHGKLLTLKSR